MLGYISKVKCKIVDELVLVFNVTFFLQCLLKGGLRNDESDYFLCSVLCYGAGG